MDDCFAGSPSHSEKRGGGTDKAKAAAAISKMEGGVSLFVRMRVVDDLKGKTLQQIMADVLIRKATRMSSAFDSTAETPKISCFSASPGPLLHLASC